MAKWWKTDWPVETNIWYFCGNLKDISSVSPGLKPPKSQPRVSSQDMGYCPNSVLSFNVFLPSNSTPRAPRHLPGTSHVYTSGGETGSGKGGSGCTEQSGAFQEKVGFWVWAMGMFVYLHLWVTDSLGQGNGDRWRRGQEKNLGFCYLLLLLQWSLSHRKVEMLVLQSFLFLGWQFVTMYK